MKKLVFATANQNKVREIQQMMGDAYNFQSLIDIGCHEDIPETQPTIEGNALQKARYVYEKYGANCFSEDTGLLIDALNGAPGVYTARYGGPQKNPEDNMNKVLKELKGVKDRNAHFKTVIALIIDGNEYTFEGIAAGTICHERTGSGGFGYDPVFMPEKSNKSFAQMSAREKDSISHRGKATAKLKEFLRSL